jgi:hypothetical protein
MGEHFAPVDVGATALDDADRPHRSATLEAVPPTPFDGQRSPPKILANSAPWRLIFNVRVRWLRGH